MRHSNLQNMLEALLEDPDEILITAKSKHAALYGHGDEMEVLVGDFSGTPKEREAEVRRIMNQKPEKV